MEKEGFWVAIGVGLILLVSLLGLLFFGQGTFASFITGAVIGSSDLQELALEPAADILPSSDDFFITNAGNGSQCGGVNQSITLSTNIVLNGSCFIVNASNIVIDGFGYQILGNGSGIGVNITYFDNVTIKNLTIFNFTYGAYVQNGTNNTLSLLRIQNTTIGIYLRENADSNNLSSNRVVNNTINGTVVEGSNSNFVYDNYFANNTNHVWDNGTNTWNRTRYCDLTTFSSVQNVLGGACIGGNFFGNYTPIANTLDGLGRAEYPVPGGNNIDYLPLMYNATLGCRVITSNINLSVNYTPLTIVGTATSGLFGCLNISGANVIVDGGGTTIRQDRIGKTETSIGYGIFPSTNHITVKNFIVDGFSVGAPLQVAYGGVNWTLNNITIKNLSSTTLDYALSGYMNASTISNVTLENLSSVVYGLGLMHGARSKPNTFNNLNITNAYGGVVLFEVMNNTFDNLTISNIDKYHFYEYQCNFLVAPMGICRNVIINFRELDGEADIVLRYKTNNQAGTQGMYRYDFKHRVTVNVTNTSGTGLSGFPVEGKDSFLNTEASINTDDNGIAPLTLTEFSVLGGFFSAFTPHIIITEPKNYTVSYNKSVVDSNLYVNLSVRLIGCAENMVGPRLYYGQPLFCPGQLLNISARYAQTTPQVSGYEHTFTNAQNATGIQMHGQHKVTIATVFLFNFSTALNISNTSSSNFNYINFRNNTRGLMFIDAQENVILQANLTGGNQDSVVETAYATSTFPTRNYFRNSTFNLSNITVEGSAEIAKQYFVTVNVTFNNGTALPAASVYAFANRTQEFETSGTTDSTGKIRLILTEVIKNVSGLIYKTPHNLSFNFSTSQGVVSNSTGINLTETNNTLVHLSISLNCTAPRDGLLIDTDTTLCPGIYDITDEDNRGIILMNNNSHKLTCDGTKFIGSSSLGTVISGINKRNLTITGCYLEGHKYGISFNDVNESQINNTVIKNMASKGIRFIDSFHNTITRNQLRDSVGTNKYGFYFSGSANNSVYNNTFDHNTVHIYFDAGFNIESGNNTFYFNQFRNALSSDVFQVTPRDFENFFNKTVSYGDGTKNVGNEYDFVCNSQIFLNDDDNDGFYDRGTDYPYNHSSERITKSAAFGVDYAPIRVYNCSSSSSSSSSSAGGGGGSASGSAAVAAAAQAEAAAAAGAVGVATAAEAAAALSGSVGSGGGGLILNLRNTGDKTIELTPQIVETPLENEQEIVDRLRGEGLADEEIKHRVNTYRVAEQQGLDTQLGRVASAFEEPVSDLEPSREFVEGEPLQIEVSLPEEITILPGETYESEVQITGGFGPERQVTLAFEVDDQVVNEQTATVGGSATAGAAINYDPNEQALETYIFVPPNEGGEYWVESQVDTALPEEVVSAITAAAIGVAEKSTLVSDLYGPFQVEKNESLFVGQQFLHGISYQGPAEVTIRIRKGNQVITTQTFPVVFAKTTGYREGLSSWTFLGLVVFLIGVLMLPLAVQLLGKRSK